MQAYHDSRENKFRSPFGAVRKNTPVHLSIDVWEEEPVNCILRVWEDSMGETIIPMDIKKRQGGHTCLIDFVPKESALYWYCFVITGKSGDVYYYGAKEGTVGGVGKMYPYMPPAFQITSYEERLLPGWYKEGIVYQIFPDRFYKSEKAKIDHKKFKDKHKNGPRRILCEDWSKFPEYEKDEKGDILSWEFYGGNLKGIEEKLDYLKDLGISVLYLNPIFESASNHRYDTGNYMEIDPLLGSNDEFEKLCKEADKRGISIILDGVFNHTGCDSIYFNKYKNYDSVGAFESTESSYRDWFCFDDSKVGYESWWGVADLPNVNENNEGFKDFIFGREDSVVRYWLNKGAKGFRLDVADELPDEFIAGIKKAVVETKGQEGLLMGEVWEDASHKVSYGKLRKYFLGDELDCTMNYPFRDCVVGLLTGSMSAVDVYELLISLYENYPLEAFFGALNLIGSHDRERILTVFGDDELAKRKMWLAIVLQMTMPGVPSIYYGDEAGMKGGRDPYNRGTFPWGDEDKDFTDMYRNMIALRRLYPTLVHGDFKPYHNGEKVFGFYRGSEKEKIFVAINAGECDSCFLRLPMEREGVTELISGKALDIKEKEVSFVLNPLEAVVLYFYDKKRLGKQMEKGRGVLCHITSLPNDKGRGSFGAPAVRFLDFLKKNNMKYWQILPLNPTDSYGSPYAGLSSFAGNIDLLDKSREELESEFKTFSKDSRDGYERFLEENGGWLNPYAVFMALKEKFKNKPWQEWPLEYKEYTNDLWQDEIICKRAEFYRYCQYVFDFQWREIRSLAIKSGINIIGDMPMYVSSDSADVWANQKYFVLDTKGYPLMEAGVPPDYFSKEGQLWGNPLYDWDRIEADGFDFWLARIKRMFELYDYVRMDHFRGFESFYAVMAGEKATKGVWKFGPGLKLFEKAYEKFGELPILAEDLGIITPAVRGLVAASGFPGMDVLQFSDTNPCDFYEPGEEKVIYTGTHDNETLLGWCKERYKEQIADDVALNLIKHLFETNKLVAIVPLQDLQGLDNDCRMNTPGVAKGNWSWQAKDLNIERGRNLWTKDI